MQKEKEMSQQLHFSCNEGSIAFIIPFLFNSEDGKTTNKCIEIFEKIKPEDDRDKYEDYKDQIRNAISYKFPNADIAFCGATEFNDCQKLTKKCYYRDLYKNHRSYKGRNLCPCLSVTRKFHDDDFQNIPRIEIYLGTYHVKYEKPNTNKFFEFYIDTFLLLTNEKGGECGYLVFNISLASIRENCIGTFTSNSLDNVIFLKHLFYKNRLKCTIIGNGENCCLSIPEWAYESFTNLLSALRIRTNSSSDIRNEEKSKKHVAFRYSIIELNNVKDKKGKIIPLSDIDSFLEVHQNQLYGLLVSDEGWRYVSKDQIQKTFKDNHWSSRRFSSAFFLEHNALLISQYDIAEQKDEGGQIAHDSFTKQWYSTYTQSQDSNCYEEYVGLRPCFPGITSLIFYAYLKAIYKETVLAKVKNYSEGNYFTDEEKYKRLAFALQRHSLSLDAVKNIEDCIYAQFGIPAELKDLRERYKREANNVQNKKIVNLTHVTAFISLSALVVSMLAIGIKDGRSLYSAGLDWTIVLLVLAFLIPIFTYIVVHNNLLEKYKKKKNRKNEIDI